MTVDDRQGMATRRWPAAAVVACVAAYAALASTTEVNTVEAALAVAVPGVTVAVVALRRPSRAVAVTPRVRRTAGLWAAAVVCGLLWEAGAYFGELTVGQYEHPTISVLVAPLLHDPIVRFALWTLWLLAGWRLLRR